MLVRPTDFGSEAFNCCNNIGHSHFNGTFRSVGVCCTAKALRLNEAFLAKMLTIDRMSGINVSATS